MLLSCCRAEHFFSSLGTEIHRATLILEGMKKAELERKGAFGLDLGGGKMYVCSSWRPFRGYALTDLVESFCPVAR
jgi:hypothetical protein